MDSVTTSTIQRLCEGIQPVSPLALEMAFKHLNNLTKPRGSLGRLEEYAARYAAIRKLNKSETMKRKVVVFVGDHGVCSEGVSAYPQEVTTLMVRNFIGGGAAINVLARQANASVSVVDVGMKDDVGALPGLVHANIRRGTGNMAIGPALTLEEACAAVQVGIEQAMTAAREGVTLLASGEMGIGNSTPAAALFAALLGVDAEDVVGPGTGLDNAGVTKKVATVTRSLMVNRDRMNGPLSTLAAVGGLEIAAIAGLCLGGASAGIPVVVDGFISGAGALVAMRVCPPVRDYLFFSHRSAEPGHARYMEYEKIVPMLDLGMRLGEGTGAALAMQLLGSAWAIYVEMATFEEVGIVPGA